MLELHDVHVRYGAIRSLQGVSLRVAQGELVALIGSNGAGKTTTLRTISGLLRPSPGSITFEEADITRASTDRIVELGISHCPEGRRVFGRLTVRENLVYFGRLLGADAARMDEVTERVDLQADANSVVTNLSGGQRARVSLAAALLGDPDLLVLDEPTVGLDPVLRRDLWDFFHTLASGGKTLLVSSHVMDEAQRCDQLILLREGGILATGTPDELRDRTGADDLDDAFLTLIHEAGAA